MSETGYVRVHRSLLGHPAFRNDAEALAFAWMVIRAQWRTTRVRYKERTISLQRGQLAVSVRDMANALDRDKAWVERLWKRLKSETMIETLSETGVSIVTICNYNEYQGDRESGETPRETPAETGARQGQDTEQEREEVKKEEKKEGGARATRLPANFLPALTPDAQSIVDGWPPGMLDHELSQFRDRSAAKGTTAKDWQASFRTWLRNADKWRNERNGHRNGSGQRIGEDGFLSALREAGAGSGYPPP